MGYFLATQVMPHITFSRAIICQEGLRKQREGHSPAVLLLFVLENGFMLFIKLLMKSQTNAFE